MSKVITFNVPVQDRKTKAVTQEARRGVIAVLPVGDKPYRFVLQKDSNGKADCLTHWESGMRVGSLADTMLRVMCARGHHARVTDRHAAELLLANLIAHKGADAVRAVIDAAPVINR
jgi:hypothetical protein